MQTVVQESYPVGCAVVTAGRVQDVVRPEYPDEAGEGPGEAGQQVEDHTDLGGVPCASTNLNTTNVEKDEK